MRALLISLLLVYGAPAWAFDCNKAARADEKAICASPELLGLDGELASAYKGLKAQALPDEVAGLVASQRAWLALRAECQADAKCIGNQINARLQQFSPQPQSGPGGVTLRPFFIYEPGDAIHWQVDVAGVRLVQPASRAFDAFVAELKAEAQRAPIADEDVVEGMQFTTSHQVVVTYASPRFISVSDGFSEYAGGAHGIYGQILHHFDLKADRKVEFADMFAPGALDSIIPACEVLLTQAKIERAVANGGTAADAEGFDIHGAVVEAVPVLSRWTFAAESAAVYFPPYAAGSYAEGEYECRMGLGFLKPLLRPGNPWVE
jgi:uncharacterized protein